MPGVKSPGILYLLHDLLKNNYCVNFNIDNKYKKLTTEKAYKSKAFLNA